MPGRRPASWVVFVMLAMRKSSYQARAALISRRYDAVEPRFQCVLTR
jgi:hypothetical protein